MDYQQAWTEFNFIEICMSYAYYNSATAGDLNCQNDLIDVMAKLIAGKCRAYTVTATATAITLNLKMSSNTIFNFVSSMNPPSIQIQLKYKQINRYMMKFNLIAK